MSRSIINSTVYRTEDVVAIIDACIVGHGVNGSFIPQAGIDLKIRYMNKPRVTRIYNFQAHVYEDGKPRYAYINFNKWAYSAMEIILVRSSKINVSPLRLLAEAAVGEGNEPNAPSILGEHLIRAYVDIIGLSGDSAKQITDACSSLCIRQDDKAKDRKAYTLVNLKAKLADNANNIASCGYAISSAEYTITRQSKKMANLMEKGPELEAKIKKLKDAIAKERDGE